MKNNIKVLILTNQLLTTCGVSKHLLYFLTEAKINKEFSFTIVCGGGDAAEKYKNLCDEVIVYPELKHENRSLKNFIKFILFLLRFQRKYKFDLIHSHNHYAANLANIVSKLSGVKALQTVHGIIEPIGKLNHYPAKYFIAVNEHINSFLIHDKRKKEKNIKLIRSGFALQSDVPIKNNSKIKVIAAGRLVKEKGFENYIKAISLLNDQTKQKSEFYLAGKGEEENSLINLSITLKVPLIFLKQVDNFRNTLLQTHVFVHPSISKSEGFPMVIIESALAKNLIISSDFRGYESVLKNSINCLVFKQNDPDELSDKLDYAINNFQDTNDLIDNMYFFAITEFSTKRMLSETTSYYREIINK